MKDIFTYLFLGHFNYCKYLCGRKLNYHKHIEKGNDEKLIFIRTDDEGNKDNYSLYVRCCAGELCAQCRDGYAHQ